MPRNREIRPENKDEQNQVLKILAKAADLKCRAKC